MSNDKLTPSQQAFIDAFANMLLSWGMTIGPARLYGYLLLVQAPVSLDEFTEVLGISKSAASTAARELESMGIAHRITDRGSKRIRYEVSKDPGIALRSHADLLGKMADLISANCDAIVSGTARQRLTDLASFHRNLKQAMEEVIDQHHSGLPE